MKREMRVHYRSGTFLSLKKMFFTSLHFAKASRFQNVNKSRVGFALMYEHTAGLKLENFLRESYLRFRQKCWLITVPICMAGYKNLSHWQGTSVHMALENVNPEV